MSQLSHFDSSGSARMVQVGFKEVTLRVARAEAVVTMSPATLLRIVNREMEKGDVREVARIAGVMAAKKTSDLIPLCHPLPLEGVELHYHIDEDTRLRIESRVNVHGRTGVEMEALTAVAVAALTIYDMCKSIDRGMEIGPIRLLEKEGGQSGHFLREPVFP